MASFFGRSAAEFQQHFFPPTRMLNRRSSAASFLSKNALVIFLVVVILYQQLLLSYRSTSKYGSEYGRIEVEDGTNDGLSDSDGGQQVLSRPKNIGDDDDNGDPIDEGTIDVDDYQVLFNKNDKSSSGGAVALSAATSTTGSKATITIVTGTHLSQRAMDLDERKQHATCARMAYALHLMWVAWEVNAYSRAKGMVRDALKQVADAGATCTLSGSRKHDMLWTFPMSWRPDAECDSRMRSVLTSGSYLREKTKIYVNWFLLRPDLVTFYNMASVEKVDVKVAISIGNDFATAAFSKENCPRFNTILDKRDVYKQRLLLVALSDIEHQVDRMKRTVIQTYVCNGVGITRTKAEENYFATLLGSNEQFSPESDGCQVTRMNLREIEKSHVGTMLRMRLFQGPNAVHVPKTVFTGPRLVFVAGLEGVGHHVFSILGRKHTTRQLYDALTEHLCDSAWDDNSLAKYGPAREKLVSAVRSLKDPRLAPRDGSNVFFLNTVYAKGDVNMYSFPWGGPRCFLKRYARVMCNIDLVELCRIAEEAGIDFRVILLKRSIGAAVVSASLHRPFGTLVSETRMLALSWALLKSGVDTVDRRFTLEINYEDMINHPADSTAKLAEHLGFDKSNPLYSHIEETLTQSGIDHPVGDGSRWKEEVDLMQLQFMSDLLGL